MRAMIFEQYGAPPKIATLPDPEPTSSGVVVEVEATGVCRTDWHGWMGHDPDIKSLPHVPGHELAGTIVETGKDVHRFQKGQRVTVPFVAGCGRCSECHAGHPQVCPDQFQPGFTAWGSFAELVALDYADHNLVELPESLPFDVAASLGCRFVTAFRGVIDQGRVRAGEWVAVHGCGGVGLSAIMIAKAAGARVVAVDITDDKRAKAIAAGADVVCDGSSDTVVEALTDATGGGAHLSLDCLGHRQVLANSVNCLRRRGRHVQLGILAADHADPPVPMGRVIGWELEIIGSHGIQAFRYDAAFALIESGALDPATMIGKRLNLTDAIETLITMDSSTDVGIPVITSLD